MLDDSVIIGLFWSRDPEAISETAKKYDPYCRKIAGNILPDPGDAEECVNDSYLRVWDSIPPQRPTCFSAFLGRIVRNVSLDRYRFNHAQKRGTGTDALFSELEDCIPSAFRTEDYAEAGELKELLNRFLKEQSREKRIVFVQRYWYAQPIREIARERGMTEAQVKSMLFRMRNELRNVLEREGVTV